MNVDDSHFSALNHFCAIVQGLCFYYGHISVCIWIIIYCLILIIIYRSVTFELCTLVLYWIVFHSFCGKLVMRRGVKFKPVSRIQVEASRGGWRWWERQQTIHTVTWVYSYTPSPERLSFKMVITHSDYSSVLLLSFKYISGNCTLS